MTDITEYYTAGAAMQVLGVTYNQLITYVDNGNIRTHQPVGKKRRVYLKEDVDNLAHLRQDTEKIRIIGKEDLNDPNHSPGTLNSKRGGTLFASGRYDGTPLD